MNAPPSPWRWSLVGLCLVSAVVAGCRGDAPEPTAGDHAPRRGGGQEFDDEPDPNTHPLAGVTLCAADGPCVTPDGRARGTMAGGVAQGEWTLMSPDGARIAQGAMVAGVPDGLWTRWNAAGQRTEEGTWVHGEPHGEWRMYRADGSLFERVAFVDGLRHGPWTMLHPNGQVAEEMQWRKGRQEGLQTDYAPDGRTVAQGHFSDHAPTGSWSCFDPGAESVRIIPAPSTRLTPAEACGHPLSTD